MKSLRFILISPYTQPSMDAVFDTYQSHDGQSSTVTYMRFSMVTAIADGPPAPQLQWGCAPLYGTLLSQWHGRVAPDSATPAAPSPRRGQRGTSTLQRRCATLRARLPIHRIIVVAPILRAPRVPPTSLVAPGTAMAGSARGQRGGDQGYSHVVRHYRCNFSYMARRAPARASSAAPPPPTSSTSTSYASDGRRSRPLPLLGHARQFGA